MSASESALELAQQLRELSETVAALKDALGPRLRVTLRALNDRSYLGQSVGVVATVTDFLTGEPRADVPVTFASTWGRLESAAGYALDRGNTLTELSDADGVVTVRMVPPLSEELSPEQQAAVETQLQALAAGAPTPQQVRPQLEEMVRQYRWEANASFRQTVDFFFQEFRPHLRETVGLRDRMLRWSHFESTVVAYAQSSDAAEEGAATSVFGSAVLNLRFKDWLGPFLQTYYEAAAAEDSLGKNLKDAKRGARDGDEMLGDFYGHIRDFVAGERGIVGSHVGGKVAANSLRDFIRDDLADLPLGTRVSVAEGLKVASGTVATAGVSVLEGFARAGTEIRRQLSTRLSGEAGSALSNIRKSIEAEANNSLQIFKGQLGDLRAGSFQSHTAELGGLRASNLDGFRNELSGIRADNVNGFQAEAGSVRAVALQGLRNDAGVFKDSTLMGFRDEIGAVRANSFRAFQADVDRAKLNSTNAFNAEIAGVRATHAQGFQSDLAGARDVTIKGFQIDVNTFRDGSLKNFQTSVGAAQTSALQGFTASLTQARGGHLQGFTQDASAARETALKGLQADAGNIKAATLTAFQNDASGLKASILQAFQSDATGMRASTLQDIQKSALAVRDSTVKTLQEQAANVKTDTIKAFQIEITNVRTATVQQAANELTTERNAQVRAYNTELTGARATSLQQFQVSLRTEANNNLISTRISKLETSVTDAHTNITNLHRRIR